jgi:hypothetical protein
MPRYDYVPLNKARGEIRLLRLLPGQFDDGIHIEIYQRSMINSRNHFPTYTALSYVWGSQDNPEVIHVDHVAGYGNRPTDDGQNKMPVDEGSFTEVPQREETTLFVTQNLFVALRNLRRLDRDRILWIDAICINQEDVAEQSVEVGRMGLIYRQAAQTIVWLGPASETSDLALETLSAISRDVTYYPEDHRGNTKEDSWAAEFEDNVEVLIAKRAQWKAIQELLGRKWFTRLWVYQVCQLGSCWIAIFLVDSPEFIVVQPAPLQLQKLLRISRAFTECSKYYLY